jgi:hypothetical protein
MRIKVYEEIGKNTYTKGTVFPHSVLRNGHLMSPDMVIAQLEKRDELDRESQYLKNYIRATLYDDFSFTENAVNEILERVCNGEFNERNVEVIKEGGKW